MARPARIRVVAGDLCFPGPAPLETWRRLTRAGAVCVQGACDRALATLDLDRVRARSEHEKSRLRRFEDVRDELGDLILARLAKLPLVQRMPLEDGGELILVHGSPVDPLESFTHDMSDEEIGALIGDDPADLVICGGSHVPFDRVVSDVRIINVGSVGEALSGGTEPERLHADAAIIEVRMGVMRVEHLVVPLGRAA